MEPLDGKLGRFLREEEGDGELVAWFECPVCRGLLIDPVTTTAGWTICQECYKNVRRQNDWSFLFTRVDWDEGKFVDVVAKELILSVYPKELELVAKIKGSDEVEPDELGTKNRHVLAAAYRRSARSRMASKDVQGALEYCTMDVALIGVVAEETRAMLKEIEAAGSGLEGDALDRIEERAKAFSSVRDPPPLRKMECMECFCCSELFFEPCTYPTGQTVCRDCITRTLEVTNPASGTAAPPVCPLTRVPLDDFAAWIHSHPDNLAANKLLRKVVRHVAPEEFEEWQKKARQDLAEHMSEDAFVPVFVCMLAWPEVRCSLHIFEPRYRLMMRRCLESGFRMFGMCAPVHGGYTSVGTMLYIREQQVLPDGRSYIETIGLRRFRVVERSQRDGYHVARISYFDDADSLSAPLVTEEDRVTRERIVTMAEECLTLLKSAIRPGAWNDIVEKIGDVPEEADKRSFWIAGMLCMVLPGFDNHGYSLLTTESTHTRLRILRDLLPRLVRSR